MVAREMSCGRHRIRRLLSDDLEATVRDEVTMHLESCGECRQHLESLAADPSWWTDASQYLQADDDATATRVALGNTTQAAADGSDRFNSQRRSLSGFLGQSSDPNMLGRLGDYEIVDILGSGGFGIVLRGYDHQLNRFVAIKVLAPGYTTSGAARRRFSREAQAAAAVVHPHVLAIHTVASQDELPYLVMPLVAGESLQDRIDREGPLSVTEVLRIGLQAADGLAAAHTQGLVHRDVKPANILLEKGVDRVLLTDFGLARAIDDASLTRSGIIAGTPPYMSPEQAQGEPVDYRSDLFSLGSVMYVMCSGHPPFRAETAMAVLRRICESRPRSLREINADIPDWLEGIIFKLLSKSPSQRFSTASELSQLLSQCLAYVQQPGVARLPAGLTFASRSHLGRRKLLGMLAIGTVGIALIAGFGWQLLPTGNENLEKSSANSQARGNLLQSSAERQDNRDQGSDRDKIVSQQTVTNRYENDGNRPLHTRISWNDEEEWRDLQTISDSIRLLEWQVETTQ